MDQYMGILEGETKPNPSYVLLSSKMRNLRWSYYDEKDLPKALRLKDKCTKTYETRRFYINVQRIVTIIQEPVLERSAQSTISL